jgi:hypothetical protein
MDFLPSDWTSFIWGTFIGGVAAFATGFLKKAGDHAYSAIQRRFFPEPLKSIEVDRKFVPSLYKIGGCAWVAELDVSEFEDKGFKHYPHPSGSPKCFRVTSDGRRTINEFLMVKPDAVKNA